MKYIMREGRGELQMAERVLVRGSVANVLGGASGSFLFREVSIAECIRGMPWQ